MGLAVLTVVLVLGVLATVVVLAVLGYRALNNRRLMKLDPSILVKRGLDKKAAVELVKQRKLLAESMQRLTAAQNAVDSIRSLGMYWGNPQDVETLQHHSKKLGELVEQHEKALGAREGS